MQNRNEVKFVLPGISNRISWHVLQQTLKLFRHSCNDIPTQYDFISP
jgi:hypothetical protein